VNRFLDYLLVVTTNNYNTIADFHTTNHSTLSSQSAFTSRYLVTALNNVFTVYFLLMVFYNGDSSASVITPLRTGYHSTPELSTELLINLTAAEAEAEAEAYCRQPAGTLTPGIGPRWDSWPYICSMSRPLFCFVFPFVDPPYL
jgi:hypothetical protein